MVYFIQAKNGPIKIGYTKSVITRLQSLQTSNTEKLIVLGTIKGDAKKEKNIHEKFKHLRISGEWFKSDPELLSFIRKNNTIILEKNKKEKTYLPKLERIFKTIGENIKLARLRRKITMTMLSERAGITRTTLYSIENGEPNVSLGNYTVVLHSLGLEKDVENLAKDDIFGRKLQDAELLIKGISRK
jgi:DNA-binding XRE family transcriptional regulator